MSQSPDQGSEGLLVDPEEKFDECYLVVGHGNASSVEKRLSKGQERGKTCPAKRRRYLPRES